ncbi:MAG: hypothetical protein Hyperionvirus16_2 [Hyperionvirus sp.]|uniref:Uncharacterized protein n=1 Tax=Hyperionvirus sp. TaxID=2487770 RepID=A0A3G5A9T4_9VIRU|nr:MAG: hypothetical protein Hyperionvirus16_2 [Hyperionvirus sp.]
MSVFDTRDLSDGFIARGIGIALIVIGGAFIASTSKKGKQLRLKLMKQEIKSWQAQADSLEEELKG